MRSSTFFGNTATLTAPFKKKNLFGWYDANCGISYDGSNNLTTWYDRSGNGNTIWNVNSAPVYVEDVVNSYPTVDFDAVDDFCYTNSENTITTGQWTLFMVWQGESAHNQYDQLGGFENGSTNFGQIQMSNSPDIKMRVWNGAYTNCPYKDHIAVDDVTSAFMLYTAVGSGDSGTGNKLIQNDTSKFDGSLNVTYTVSEIGQALAIMNRGSGVHAYLGGGKVAEVIWFDAALSDDDRAEVATYLNNKYGLY